VEVTEEEAYIEFSDNGIGIGEEHLHRIFDMFYRANHNAKGSGLGLFIFKETLTKLNGTVRVKSREGEGTTFSIQLPNSLKAAGVMQHAVAQA